MRSCQKILNLGLVPWAGSIQLTHPNTTSIGRVISRECYHTAPTESSTFEVMGHSSDFHPLYPQVCHCCLICNACLPWGPLAEEWKDDAGRCWDAFSLRQYVRCINNQHCLTLYHPRCQSLHHTNCCWWRPMVGDDNSKGHFRVVFSVQLQHSVTVWQEVTFYYICFVNLTMLNIIAY